MQRWGIIPVLRLAAMELVTTQIAARLTGLSTDQLREWTSRRALISADVRPKGRGSSARYSWQTILLLRLAVVLRDSFKFELEAHRKLFADVGERLRTIHFASLWGKALALRGGCNWDLLDRENLTSETGNLVVLGLDPHLGILISGFPFLRPTTPEQLDLFSGPQRVDREPKRRIDRDRRPIRVSIPSIRGIR